MMTSDPETFESFKNSFSYGSRTDLNFKFLKTLSDEEAADFFQELLWKLGDSIHGSRVPPWYQGIEELSGSSVPPRPGGCPVRGFSRRT